MQKQITSNEIQQQGQAAGFDLVGIAPPTLPKKYTRRYQEWLSQEQHGNLTYLEYSKERRINPEQVLPNIQSVIVCAINYYTKDTPQPSSQHGRIAKYARGKDYHTVIEQKQKQFISTLKEHWPNHNYKSTVDYGHILEKAYAEQAGLGFIGRNSNLITREYGSYVFLSTILTTLAIKPTEPAGERLGKCGACNRCQQQCPTQAINGDGTINATKCLSYWTIENKTKHIPAPIAKNINNNTFGCDTCQLACPHNIRAQKTTHPEFQKQHGVGEWLHQDTANKLSKQEWNDQFKKTALERTKQSGIQRNIRYQQQNTRQD